MKKGMVINMENEISLNNTNEKNLNNNLNNDISNNIVEEQQKFFETNIGKAVNAGINIGLRLALPDLIENQVIEVKDILMGQGIKDGIKTIANSVMDFGKSVTGVFTGKFENITQVENAIKNGGVIDTTSKILGGAIDLAKSNKLINASTAKMLKQGKNTILNSISNGYEEMLTSQIKSIEKINKNITNWNLAYDERDINTMKKEYKKLEKELEKIMPLENTIKEARKIENIHNLILNKGENFELTKDELELAEKLV